MRVRGYDPQKVFLTSDCIGIPGMESVPGYGMVAHGTWQDSWCHPVAWSYGLFPNWRNVLWSCNWSPLSNFQFTQFGVKTFGVPVAISNGWGDDCGPSEWQPDQRDRILALFEERCAQQGRVRYLTTDPATLMAAGPHVAAQGDPLRAPDPGWTNWASPHRAARPRLPRSQRRTGQPAAPSTACAMTPGGVVATAGPARLVVRTPPRAPSRFPWREADQPIRGDHLPEGRHG